MQNQNQRTLVDKLKECKQIYIQNLEKNSVQRNMIFMFLKKNKIVDDVRRFAIYPNKCLVKLQFIDHQKAKSFYDAQNFKSVILIRPLNLYFGLQLTDAEMKKYYLQGITDENQRQLFEAARKMGICKLDTSYTQVYKGKLKPNGILSFIRQDQLIKTHFEALEADLKAIGIKITPYVAKKDRKCLKKAIGIKIPPYVAEKDRKCLNKGQ